MGLYCFVNAYNVEGYDQAFCTTSKEKTVYIKNHKKENEVMRKSIKILASVILAATICLSFSTTAFAGYSSCYAGYYGTLSGSVSVSGVNINTQTHIDSNPDNAYLTLTLSVQDRYGNSLGELYGQSIRGLTDLPYGGPGLNSNAYKVFGTHGVQGGSTNPAYAVYTATSV
jgi:hypothetical protein